MKPILIHTHFHGRKTGVTRSIENVLPYFQEQFDTYVYGNNITGNTLTKAKLIEFFKSKKKVIVHCHRNNEIIKMLWHRFLGRNFKLIATRHAATEPSKLTRFLLNKADVVITLTSEMSETLNIANSLIGHGVETNVFIPKQGVSLPKVKQQNIILNTGRIRKSKGQLDLMNAAKILKQHSAWALVFVGRIDKPQFLVELKDLMKQYTIEDQVYFFDETKEIVSFYQAAKIMVAPSYSEGFSLVTAEAMSCECKVVATKNVGVHNYLIHHEKNGYLYESGNTEQLKSILKSAINTYNPEIGKAARETIESHWSSSQEAEKLISTYLS